MKLKILIIFSFLTFVSCVNSNKVDDSLDLLSKTKYIEITLYPGQMIYIPHSWYYGYINEEDSFSVVCKSESIFSYFLMPRRIHGLSTF